MKLFENEQIEQTLGSVTLTNLRIRQVHPHTTSVLLKNISSIEIRYSERSIFLAIGLFCAFASFVGYMNQSEYTGLFILTTIALIVYYFATRKHTVTISSNGGAKIVFQTKGLSHSALTEFIDKVERSVLA